MDTRPLKVARCVVAYHDDADDDDAATEIAHSVLYSPDLWPQHLWRWLDRGSKAVLRCVSVDMRKQVDPCVAFVSSPEAGFTAEQLESALVRWPRMVALSLLGVSSGEALRPLSTASLAGLKSLTVRERAPLLGLPVTPVPAWGLLEFSTNLAATLQVIDVSFCASLTSIDALRSCAHMRCLRMAGGTRVPSLSPLAVCIQLEELWLAGNNLRITTLAPLKACPKLCKLDLRGCRRVLRDQVEDPQRVSCLQLAHPASVELEGLAHQLQPSMPPGVQAGAARALGVRAITDQDKADVAAAGAIPPLVQLLGQYSPAEHLWRWLDRGSKAALRCVSVAMRKQVDPCVAFVSSPEAGFDAEQLESALVRWPRMVALSLLGVSSGEALRPLSTVSLAGLKSLTVLEHLWRWLVRDGKAAMRVSSDEALRPLTTASLAGLKSLTVRERVPRAGLPVAPVSAWHLLEFSSTIAAALQVVDVSCCASLISIDAVRGCAQLRCLRMSGRDGVSSLSPLAACSQLEELWMAGNNLQITTLAPLKACPKLCKLDLRGCRPALCDQHLWLWLDRGSKAALRCVSVAMRDQVDACVAVLVSSEAGLTAEQLASALARWPRVAHLTLLGVSSGEALLPFTTASLAGLRTLTVREVVQYQCGVGGPVPVQWHGAARGQGPAPSLAWLSAREPGFVASVHGGHAFVSKAIRAPHVECRQRTDAPSFCRLRVSRLPLSMMGPARPARAAGTPGGPPPGGPPPGGPPPGGPPPGGRSYAAAAQGLPVGPGLQHQLPIIEEEADDGGGGSDHGSYGHGAGDGDDDDDGAGSDGGAGSAGGAMAVIAAAAAAAAAGPSDEHAARHKRALRTDRQTQGRMLQLDAERRALEGRRELKAAAAVGAAAAAVGEAALLAALLADERMLDASQTTGRKRGGGDEEPAAAADAPLDTPVGLSQPKPRRGEAAPEAAEDGEEGRRVARRTTGGEEGDAAVPAAAPAAAGPDGIPVDVWRKLGEPAFELLAAIFTAVGATGGTPPGFLDGVVASIYKAKNAADAANYRPLTMLGSDYRILAKVLATRWTPLLSAVVGPEQTAFLAGRRISDNICLTQMLPGLLAANAAEGVGPTGAALALLDFRKAYDTIDRGFLIAVMEAVGVGDGVLAWTRTILTHTYASAEVNGFISAPRKYAAGVRQGCPAAPALFLFLGHALACFLRTCPAVGVEVVPGCRVTCPQYADDCMPLLRSCAPADVAALVETMAVFGRATGLVLNLGKCGILPLGSAGEGLLAGAEVAGLRVLDAGVSLGVPVSAGLPPPEGVTGVCRERLAAAYTKLARFPMSAFGRGHAAATYGVSRILFRAVHCGMTPEAERVLSRWTATLVDRSVGPDPPAELPRWASSVPAAQPAPLPGGGGAAGEPRWVGFAHGPGVVGKLTCKLAVALQLRAVVDERRVRRAATVEAALALDHGPHGGPRATDAQVFAGLRGLEAAVPTLWRMPLLNARKEPIWRLWPPARSVAVERAGELATMDLWDALASFAEGGGMPRGWAGVVGPTHPFVGVVDGGLTLNKTS
ncbi:hypothetical protein FOA52_002530 [Chlamydomonas sp. UWO 241]|nr:hypothetical protein FOA52_002530 [Chlamydomonas sp. UWO 241]